MRDTFKYHIYHSTMRFEFVSQHQCKWQFFYILQVSLSKSSALNIIIGRYIETVTCIQSYCYDFGVSCQGQIFKSCPCWRFVPCELKFMVGAIFIAIKQVEQIQRRFVRPQIFKRAHINVLSEYRINHRKLFLPIKNTYPLFIINFTNFSFEIRPIGERAPREL